MADPTQTQLDARLNPTATDVYIPQDGIFTSTGGYGDVLYIRQGNTVKVFDITTLLTPQEKQSAGNHGVQVDIAKQKLQQQYGFNPDTLPKVNMGDFFQSLARQGVGYNNAEGSYIAPLTNSTNINEFITAKPASLNTQTINGTPNALATPEQIAAQKLDPNWNNGSGTGVGGTASAPTATPVNKNVAPPTVNLQPGSTDTAAVKQLQDYLVANGYMTQAQVDTGYGTYGPQTTAAVNALQQKLGVNAGSAPGYWGPVTMSAISTAGSVPQGGVATNTQGGTGTPTDISAQKALLLAINDVAETAAATGKPPVSFAEALELAGKDPTILAKYADMAKMDLQGFTQSLNTLKEATSLETDARKRQFENDRQQLAENAAATGTAYSGFRNQAQQDLAKTEAGIVTSSRSTLKNNLNTLTSAYEAKYGTGSTPTAQVAFNDPTLLSSVGISGLRTTPGVSSELLTGEKAGGITGSVEPAKKSEILNKAINSYAATAFPATG